ncbi:MAG: IS200/IS605 family transposase [Planctomycetes bacterium]|nr:IS200/IS605 family transposase [Planctomycetota bacterium]
MKDWKSLAHTKWDCKYHLVLVPKYRHKVFFGQSRKRIGEILRELCRYKGIELMEGCAQPNHIHMFVSIPPNFSVAMTIGYLKGRNISRTDEYIYHRNSGNLQGKVVGSIIREGGINAGTHRYAHDLEP